MDEERPTKPSRAEDPLAEIKARIDAMRERDDTADAAALAAAEVEYAGLDLAKAMADEAALDPLTEDKEKLACYAMQRERKQEVLKQKLAAAQALTT